MSENVYSSKSDENNFLNIKKKFKNSQFAKIIKRIYQNIRARARISKRHEILRQCVTIRMQIRSL